MFVCSVCVCVCVCVCLMVLPLQLKKIFLFCKLLLIPNDGVLCPTEVFSFIRSHLLLIIVTTWEGKCYWERMCSEFSSVLHSVKDNHNPKWNVFKMSTDASQKGCIPFRLKKVRLGRTSTNPSSLHRMESFSWGTRNSSQIMPCWEQKHCNHVPTPVILTDVVRMKVW